MLIHQVQFVRTVIGARMARFREAHGRGDVGASAIELAIITAVVVGLAVLVLVVVQQIVQNRTTEIQQKNNGIP